MRRDCLRHFGSRDSLHRRRIAQHFFDYLFVFLRLHGARRINQFSARRELQQRHTKHAHLMLVGFRKLT